MSATIVFSQMPSFLSEASFWTPESLVPSAWAMHAPFAFWLMETHRPGLLVELGSHFGYSYFAFNQALKQLKVKGRCFAIDTWQGDEHAGYYGNEVYDSVAAYNQAHYADFSELLRMDFNEAVARFQDGSIDLLHIDGRHFYSDVRHDFDTWKSKLSDRAVVLLHDTNVRSHDFGVYRLWEELQAEHPSFEFLTGHGLGVLGLGKQMPEPLRNLFGAASNKQETEWIRTVYGRLGAAAADRMMLQHQIPRPTEAAEASVQLVDLQTRHNDLTEMYQQAVDQYKGLQSSYGDLVKQHDALQAQCSQWNERWAASERAYQELQIRHESLVPEHKGLQSAHLQLTENYSQHKQTSDQLHEQFTIRLKDLQNKFDGMHADTLQMEESKSGQLNVLANRLSEQLALTDSLKAKTSQLQMEAAGLQTQLRQKDLSFRSALAAKPKTADNCSERSNGSKFSPVDLRKRLIERRAVEKYRPILLSLFDEDFYLSRNPDVKQAGQNALQHYLNHGGFEGRDPHPLFDSEWYRAQNPDVRMTGQNPLLHYVQFGAKEGRNPHPLFQSAFYIRQNPGLAEGSNPLQHYIQAGGRNVGNPHPLFDTDFYLSQLASPLHVGTTPLGHYLSSGWGQNLSPHFLFDGPFYRKVSHIEAIDENTEPLRHYMQAGSQAGFAPHPLFDSRWYQEQNPDTRNINPLLHYIEFGASEDRNPHPLFDCSFYRQRLSLPKNINALQHYLAANGRQVGNPHPLFHTGFYLAQHSPALPNHVNPLVHYLESGWQKGRTPHPLFDPAFLLGQESEIAGQEPLSVYLQLGKQRLWNPHPLFDSRAYCGQNPGLLHTNVNPLLHYVQVGWQQNRNPHPLFDADFYRSQVSLPATVDALEHYLLKNGRATGDPHPLFDTAFYLEQQTPQLKETINPLVHYSQYGWQQAYNPNRLFDVAFYWEANPDVSQKDPLRHYLEFGTAEGRNPHPLFATKWYAKQNPDVTASGINPLAHFLHNGFREGRNPHPLFDLTYYCRNTSSISDNVNPLIHYLSVKGQAQTDTHPLFDTTFYLRQQISRFSSHISPLEHYLRYGWRRQLGTHPLFDAAFYRESNPDLPLTEPLTHYLEEGAAKGLDPHPLFNTTWFVHQNPDVASSETNPLVYFLSWANKEELSPSVFFDTPFYLKTYPDVKAAGINPLLHYVEHGSKEDRLPNPDFKPGIYRAIHPELVESNTNPLIDYVRRGRFEEPKHNLNKVNAAKRRIVFLSGEPGTPGHQYRVSNFAEVLPGNFFDVVVVHLPDLPNRMREFVQVDLVWIWRAGWSSALGDMITVARNAGAKLVFDIDDLMFRPELARTNIIDGIRSQGFTEEQIQRFYSNIQAVLGHVDHCTAPTSSLARELKTFYKAATVIPNGFDAKLLRRFREAALLQNTLSSDGLIRIGYASGTLTHQRDLAVAAEALAGVLKTCPQVRLVLFRNTVQLEEFPELAPYADQIEWRNTVPLSQLPFEYARFAINIAPLETGNPYCEAKSELKYFEAALVGVPTVASPTQPFADAIQDGETGFLAKNEDEWRTKLLTLVHSPDQRKAMAERARQQVTWLYGPERRALLLSRLINQLLSPADIKSQLFTMETRVEGSETIPTPAVPVSHVVYRSSRRRISRVSVVIPVYNYAHLLPEALESVRTQTVKDVDLIVVDDRSTDNSLAVAEQWLREHAGEFNHVLLLQNQTNSKLGQSRNAGVNACDTEFFLPLDPDNLLLPDFIETSLELLEQSGAAFAYPTIEIFGDQTGTLGLSEFDPALFPCGNYIDAMAMVRKACWIAVGGYSPLEPVGWEDFDFWCKLAEKGLFGVRVPKVIARYRVHGSSMLRTITELPENKPRVIADLNTRHPWLNLRAAANKNGDQHKPAPQDSAASSGVPWETLVSILQCPETGEHLLRRDDHTLISEQSGRTWPLVNGRPVFTVDGTDVMIQAEDHVSNQLPREALRIIHETSGLVLNLSAGASARRYENVVELEYTIFKNTNVVGDVHRLPFQEQVFDAVICMNAFEHYREPDLAMAEIHRTLKPGARLYLHTAFLQPLHEAPHHYYNCTEFGLKQWLHHFENIDIQVSSNFNPIYTLAWLASEMEAAFQKGVSAQSAEILGEARLKDLMVFWRDPGSRNSALWRMFYELPSELQRKFAAGWEARATKGATTLQLVPKVLHAASGNGVAG